MSASKASPQFRDEVVDSDGLGSVMDGKGGTADDRADMLRMGKAQDLRRSFKFFSIFGFSAILMATWEGALSLASIGIFNGGTAGFIWMFLIVWIGLMFVTLTMAEMVSMAPTTGGQYHWVSEFSPRKYQKLASYIIGWLGILGWQGAAGFSSYLAGTQIQGIAILNNPEYVPEPWHGTLLTIAVAAIGVFCNTFLARKLAVIEILVLIIHIFGFIGIIATLWALSPRADAAVVFTQFNDGGGWGSLGGSALLGLSASIAPLLGGDAAVHMAEEVHDASRIIPRSMIWTTLVNGALAWVMIITFCMCMGDLSVALESPTGYPFMQVFYNSTQSTSAATTMSAFIILIAIFSNITVVATASRQLFAFSRDRGVPFSAWFSYVRPGWDVPVNSISVTFVSSALLSLINLGSPVALNDVTSLSITAALTSYIVSIGCITWRRWTKQPLLPSKFNLGSWGLFVNITSEIFLVVSSVLVLFPVTPNPDAASMNWNIVIFAAVVLISVTYYSFYGKNQYVGPVEYVRQLD